MRRVDPQRYDESLALDLSKQRPYWAGVLKRTALFKIATGDIKLPSYKRKPRSKE